MSAQEQSLVQQNIKQQILSVFSENLNVTVPSETTDLLETGLLDSLKLVDLLVELERRFGKAIDISDLEVDNFRCIESIAIFITQQ
jgi:methoxymalonate biosynthesis acyl carrier protein